MTQTAAAPLALAEVSALANQMKKSIGSVREGKPHQIHMAVLVLLAQGHLLLEDVPGVGKTVLAKALGRSISGVVSRIQFTPDLLPSDVTGVSVFNQQSREFEFKPGGIFANIVLGDEINRASPKTQSAMLEALAEGQVSADGQTYQLKRPFMVVATQNPIEMEGTYPLPLSAPQPAKQRQSAQGTVSTQSQEMQCQPHQHPGCLMLPAWQGDRPREGGPDL